MPNITTAQLNGLLACRNMNDEKYRKRRKAAIFAEIRSMYGISKNTKLKVEIDAVASPGYCVLKDSNTGLFVGNRPTFSGPSDGNANDRVPAVRVPAPAMAEKAKNEWQNPAVLGPGSSVKPAIGGMTQERGFAARAPIVSADNGPTLKLGSISLDDALRLLRTDGDVSDSFAASSGSATAPVFLKDERLYFVL